MLTAKESKKPTETFHLFQSMEMEIYSTMETEGGNEPEDIPFPPRSGSDLAKLQTEQEIFPTFQDEPSTWEAPTLQGSY